MDKKQGKLIVIDGIDGSGKTTQINLLKKYFEEKNIPYEVISFPQYGKNEYSRQIKDYLEGKLGKLEEVDPYSIAKAYANDRLDAKDLIENWLNEGKIVLANRYVSASKAHLGANLDESKREEFLEWIDLLEYQTNGMPRTSLTILLNIDAKVGQKNALDKKDIHEESIKHLEKAQKIYLELSKAEQNWVVVNCMIGDKIRPKEDIHKEITSILNDKRNEH